MVRMSNHKYIARCADSQHANDILREVRTRSRKWEENLGAANAVKVNGVDKTIIFGKDLIQLAWEDKHFVGRRNYKEIKLTTIYRYMNYLDKITGVTEGR